MNCLRPCTAALVLLLLASSAGADESVLQLRFAQPDAAEGLEKMETPVGGYAFWLHPEVELSEADVDSAFADVDDYVGRPSMELVLDDEGAQVFARLTRENVGRHLAVVVDGELIMAPVIQGVIAGGRLQVSGFEDAKSRDRMLEALAEAGVAVGSRPAPPSPEELRERMERALGGEIDSLRTEFSRRDAQGFSDADTLLAQELFDLAELSYSQGRPELSDELSLLAARVWARALPREPQARVQVLDLTIQAFIAAGELDEADRLWAKLRPLLAEPTAAVEQSMPMITSLCGLGLEHARAGNLDRAAEIFTSALELPDPPWPWACRLGLIETLLAQGKIGRARELCDEAMRADESRLYREQLRDLSERIEEAGVGG